MTPLPSSQTPLYHHPLPALEDWLRELGGRQDQQNPCLWDLHQPLWSARIELEVDSLVVRWQDQGQVSERRFPYGLTRADAEAAILAGP
ncbi:MAG: DUF3143 domain-containing protein [Synechococcaceae cyanobacterium ELA445]